MPYDIRDQDMTISTSDDETEHVSGQLRMLRVVGKEVLRKLGLKSIIIRLDKSDPANDSQTE